MDIKILLDYTLLDRHSKQQSVNCVGRIQRGDAPYKGCHHNSQSGAHHSANQCLARVECHGDSAAALVSCQRSGLHSNCFQSKLP